MNYDVPMRMIQEKKGVGKRQIATDLHISSSRVTTNLVSQRCLLNTAVKKTSLCQNWIQSLESTH